jgi:hypothetical protein
MSVVSEDNVSEDWEGIATAPFDRDLELAVLDFDGTHALVFPCRRLVDGWIDAGSKKRIELSPTHWRDWRPRSERLLKEIARCAPRLVDLDDQLQRPINTDRHLHRERCEAKAYRGRIGRNEVDH